MFERGKVRRFFLTALAILITLSVGANGVEAYEELEETGAVDGTCE